MYFNVNSSKEYDNTMRPGLLTKIADNTPPMTNQYSYFDAFNAVRIKSGANNKSELVKKLGYLYKGDVITASVEMWHVGGDKPKLLFDKSTGANSYGLNNIIRDEPLETENFELVEFSFTIPTNGYYVVSVGFFTSDVGEAYVRSFKANIDKNQSSGSSAYYDQRLCFVTVENGEPLVRSVYKKDGVTLSAAGTSLTITWDEPLTISNANNTMRALSFVGNYQMTDNVIPICGESTNEFLTVRFYDLVNNVFLQVSAVTKCEFPIHSIG